jgi:hypothetical protein
VCGVRVCVVCVCVYACLVIYTYTTTDSKHYQT